MQVALWQEAMPVDGVELRPYQRDAVGAIGRAFETLRSALIVMATGLGKTVTFGAVAKDWPGRVLVLAHRSELLDQARAKVAEMTGEIVGLEQAAWWASSERIVVGSVQTLAKSKRLGRFARDPFTLVIVDEAHHATARSYRAILDAFPGAKILGVTATPDRGDGKALGMVFQKPVFRMDIEDGIDGGWLVPVTVQSAYVDELDLSHVKSAHGDLADGELDEAVAGAVAPIARVAIESCGARKTIIFTPGVRTAHALAGALNNLRPGSAAAIDGKMDDFTRRSTRNAHRRGDIQFICNCAILTEGYDDPSVACVLIARPTKSRSLYAQMAGRGLRILPNVGDGTIEAAERLRAIAESRKPDCLLLDIAGNAGKHSLVSPVDILGGRYTEEEKVRAKKKIAEGKAVNADEALKEARQDVAKEKDKRTARAAAGAKIKYRLIQVDPFKTFGVSDPAKYKTLSGDPPTQGQLRKMAELGIDAAGVTKGQAQKLIGTAFVREKAGLCNFRQVRWLAQFGIDGRRMYQQTGKRLADAYRANGKFMPAKDVINRIINDGLLIRSGE